MKSILSIVVAAFLLTSCGESRTTSTKEEQEIKSMDSTGKKVKDARDDLEDQTKKVENSLEKLDKEFEDTTD